MMGRATTLITGLILLGVSLPFIALIIERSL